MFMIQVKGYCGMDCSACATYQATRNDDDTKRAAIAHRFAELNDMRIDPQEINCDGCNVRGGRLLKIVADCSIRNRALKTKVSQ